VTRPKNISDEEWREREKKYYENRTEEQKERKNATTREWRAKWRANLSEEQKERRREQDRRRRANLSEEQREALRVRVRKENKKYYENRTEEQKERRREQDRRRRANLTEEQKERRRETARAARRADPDKYQPRLRFKRARDNLYDSYVRGLLKRYEWGVEPPQELIELKRVQLKIRRYLNQGEQK